ncbi:hypothetical protein AG1IA_03933 [Rhizoctonia solani AG-1 IA]|uniref:Uncharacterized protein n=1 Tax=Thanatephorus cucumeris (strain AG1-IA) TaxID=983506 RepID=L8WV85_THACA|nr:hypothetical protein AG1IA_03933 [Rhizoctonia solani AG-1 IA]
MPKHRQRHSDSHQLQLARRFLQLDADIRVAAADGLFPFQKERPESPAQVYPYDAQLQHPKPKLASGAIQIRQLEHVCAGCKGQTLAQNTQRVRPGRCSPPHLTFCAPPRTKVSLDDCEWHIHLHLYFHLRCGPCLSLSFQGFPPGKLY